MKRESTISKNSQIEDYLSEHYDFRYNIVRHRAEYRPKEKGEFVAIDRYRVNSLKRVLDKELELQTSAENLYSIIESSFSPRVNPVQAYFQSLPYTEEGAIQSLAECVLTNSDKWVLYLRKWLVAVVANALDDTQSLK